MTNPIILFLSSIFLFRWIYFLFIKYYTKSLKSQVPSKIFTNF
jgi:hypothetical protein